MKKKILVVDDTEPIRRVIQAMLIHADFDVVMANDGQMALTVLSGFKPDLIVSDIDMPNLDGIELAKKVLPNIPIILMTGNPQNNSRLVEIEKEGLVAPIVLLKPFSQMSLVEEVIKILHIN